MCPSPTEPTLTLCSAGKCQVIQVPFGVHQGQHPGRGRHLNFPGAKDGHKISSFGSETEHEGAGAGIT